MDEGLVKVGAGVPVTMVTQTKFHNDLVALTNAEESFGIARQNLNTAYALFAAADAGVTDWLKACRAMFIGHFGYFWSPQWAAAGWINNSTAIPSTIDARFVLAGAVISFLTKNHSFEVEATGVTAANGQSLLDVAITAQSDVADKDQAQKDADQVRGPLRDTLVADMRAVIKNLSGLLAKDDPRWVAFGLNMPASKTTPDKPTGLSVMLDEATGSLIMTCEPPALAQRFRWRGREAGMPFQLLARSVGPLGRTKPIAPGTTLELMVQAVNGGSQSVPSDSVFFTVPPAAGAANKAAATAAEPVVNLNGNGVANGNGAEQSNGSRKARA